jgi:uncharacterized protein (TIGR03437 family)
LVRVVFTSMMFRYFLISSFFALVCWTNALGQQYVISTIAGNGSPGFSGDGGAGTSAQVNLPGGIAVDSSSNLYIADGGNHRVRKLSNGIMTTVAGNGTAGYAGDNGAATSAQLNDPVGVAVDSSGNLYIADAGNNVVRKVSNGTITTFAGNNKSLPGYGGDGGAATSAQLNDPVGVAVDSAGTVYIADANNNAIRKVSGGNISTFPGGTLHHPDGVAVDPVGNLYVADTGGRRVVYLSGGTATVFAGNGNIGFSGDNGLAVNAALNDPVTIAVDSAGYVYIADTINSRIRKVSPNDGVITTIAGQGRTGYSGDGGPATSAKLYFPHGVAVDTAGNVYISDEGDSTIRMLQVAAPQISANAVVNAASFAHQISGGSLATVFASNITGAKASASAPLPTSLAGVSVSVNGKNAPLLYVTSTQVNFQVPWKTDPGLASVAIIANGVVSNAVTVPVVAAAPGLFTYGSGRAVVQNSDFTLNSPNNPAKAGSTIMAYLTGSGPVDPPVADGALAPASPPATATSSSSATIGSAPAKVSFAGLAPGFVGLVQVNIVVPSGLPKGDYPLTVTIAGQDSNSALVSVTP